MRPAGEAPAARLRSRRTRSALPASEAAVVPGGGAEPAAAAELEPRRAALLRVLRVAAREVLYVGAIVVLAVWGASRFLESTSPDNVRFPLPAVL